MNENLKEIEKKYKDAKGVFIILTAITTAVVTNVFISYYIEQNQPVDTAPATFAVEDATISELPSYSLDDVALHGTPEDCWMSAYGNVYDLTEEVAINNHPGGMTTLVSGCGKDMTSTFERIHSPQAKEDLKKLLIGILEE